MEKEITQPKSKINPETKANTLSNPKSNNHSLGEDIENKEEELNRLNDNLIDLFQKLQFRKVLTIIQEAKYLESYPSYWKLSYLKIVSIQKIIEKKFQKYNDNLSNSHISNWLEMMNREIFYWFNTMSNKNQSEEEAKLKLELVILFILIQNYNYAKYCFKHELLYDCISFLGLGERLIKSTSNFFVLPDTFLYSSKLFIFLTSLYISNDNISSARIYIPIILKLSYKELELRMHTDIRSLLFLSDYPEDLKASISEIFFNLSTAMCLLGICYEKEDEYKDAKQAFNQAEWFSKVIEGKEIKPFNDLINKITNRLTIRNQLIDFFTREERKLKFKVKVNKTVKKSEYSNKEKMYKYEQLENYLDTIEIPEVDDDENDLLNELDKNPFSQNVSSITKQVHLLNYLMSEKFQGVINKMKKIEINCLDKHTVNTIQKTIIDIKKNERMKMIERERRKKEVKRLIQRKYFIKQDTSEDNNSIRLNTEPNSIYKYKILKNIQPQVQTNYNTTYQSTRTSNSGEENKNIPTISKPTKHQSVRKKIFSNRNKDNVPKIKHCEFLFNKKFQRKLQFLDKQYIKELTFQKNLLRCKENEKPIADYEAFNERDVNEKCDYFFERKMRHEMEKIMKKEREKEKEMKLNENEIKIEMEREKEKEEEKEKEKKKKFKIDEVRKEFNLRNKKYIQGLDNEIRMLQDMENFYEEKRKRLRANNH